MNKSSKTIKIVISIIVSVLLWVYVDIVDQTQGTTTVRDIAIEFVGESDALAARNLMMISAQNRTVTLVLKGQRSVISRLSKKEIRVRVDLSGITAAGTQSLPYQVIYPDSVSQSSVQVKSASISTVTVEVGPLYTKTVAVQGLIQGTVAEGYSAGEFRFSPDSVEVSGQEKDVAQVACARVVMELDHATESITRVLPLEAVGYDGQVLKGLDLRFSNEIVTATLPILMTKELPLRVNLTYGPGAQESIVTCRIQPESVVVSGDVHTISAMEAIVLDSIDVTQLMSDWEKSYTIPLPADVENLSGVSEAVVSISFDGVTTQTIGTSNIMTSVVPQGYSASIVSKSLVVLIRGAEEELEQVRPENVRVVADLSGIQMATGTYTVPAKISVDGHTSVGAVGRYEVTVRIAGEKK